MNHRLHQSISAANYAVGAMVTVEFFEANMPKLDHLNAIGTARKYLIEAMDRLTAYECEICHPEKKDATMTDKKYCTDCRHCFVPPSGLEYARCLVTADASNNNRFVAREFDTPEKQHRYCSAARADAYACAPDAKWFQAKLMVVT